MPVQSDNDYFLIVYLDLIIYLKATFTKSAFYLQLSWTLCYHHCYYLLVCNMLRNQTELNWLK